MHTEREPVDYDSLAEMGYERRDINIGAIKKWTIGYFILTVVFFAVGFLFYRWLAPVTFARAATGKPPVTRRIPPAPNPLLQDNVGSKLDIMELRQQEDEAMATYGWANQQRTAVRIPVDKAMDLIAQKGANIVPAAAPIETPIRPPAGSSQPTIGGGNASGQLGATGPGDAAPATPIPSQAPQPNRPPTAGRVPREIPTNPSNPNGDPSRPSAGATSSGATSSGAPAGTNSASN